MVTVVVVAMTNTVIYDHSSPLTYVLLKLVMVVL